MYCFMEFSAYLCSDMAEIAKQKTMSRRKEFWFLKPLDCLPWKKGERKTV